MEPANGKEEVDDSERNLPKTRPLSFFTTLRSTSPKRKAKVEISEDDYSDMPRLTTVSPTINDQVELLQDLEVIVEVPTPSFVASNKMKHPFDSVSQPVHKERIEPSSDGNFVDTTVRKQRQVNITTDMTPYDDSIVDAEDIDPDVLRTLDELDLLDTLGMDSEDIAGALTSNPSSNDTEGWIQKMKKPKNKKKPKRKRIPTALLSPSNTNKTPPLRPTMVPLRQAHHRRIFARRDV
jgi:hypothetical protein